MALKYGGNGKDCVEWVEICKMNRGLDRINCWGLLVFDYMGRVLPSLDVRSQLMLQCYFCTTASISYFL